MSDDDERDLWRRALATERTPVLPPVPAETVWRAVHGELPPETLGPLLERLQVDADLQVAWQLAREMGAEPERSAPRLPRWAPWVVALAAGLLLVLWSVRPGPVPSDAWRGEPVVQTTLPGRGALPRDQFVLVWEMPAGARANVELRDANLDLLGESGWIDASTWEVPPEMLIGVPAGGEVVWRVRVQDRGVEVRSASFVQTVEDGS